MHNSGSSVLAATELTLLVPSTLPQHSHAAGCVDRCHNGLAVGPGSAMQGCDGGTGTVTATAHAAAAAALTALGPACVAV